MGEYSGLSEARYPYPQVEIDICFYTYAAVNLFLLFLHSLKAPVKKLKLIFLFWNSAIFREYHKKQPRNSNQYLPITVTIMIMVVTDIYCALTLCSILDRYYLMGFAQ